MTDAYDTMLIHYILSFKQAIFPPHTVHIYEIIKDQREGWNGEREDVEEMGRKS